MRKTVCPKDCTRRSTTCRRDCEAWAEHEAKKEKEYAARAERHAYDNYLVDAIRRTQSCRVRAKLPRGGAE